MFNSVTSFFFGGSNESEQTPETEIDLQTTPAPENEWILVDVPEHPSMSVYNSRCTGSTGEASDLSESSNDDESPSTRKNPPRKVKNTVAHQAPRKPNAVAARAGIESQILSIQSSQRSRKHSESKKLSRHNIQRLNKCHNRQTGSGKPYNRSGRIHCPAVRSSTPIKH